MGKEFDLHRYDDILDMPHHVSANRRRMTHIERGAQFSPFAALTGYEAAVEEAARLTDSQRELSEDMKAILDQKIQLLADCAEQEPSVRITYFVPDARKVGGAYVRVCGTVAEIDGHERCIRLADGQTIPIEAIREIDGALFGRLELE